MMVDSYDYRLVALSVLVSILAAYAACDLSERLRDARGRAWLAWLVGGATAHGIGTWSMHYIGMLAFHLQVPVQYDWPTVLLSLLVSILGSAAALVVVSRRTIGWPWALAGSIFLGGVGISGLHYTAMAAMRLQGMHPYAAALVTLSVVLAIVLSLMALSLTFLVRDNAPRPSLRNHGSAVLRGSANPVRHYTAMAAVSFRRSSELPDLSHAVSISSLGVRGISIVPVMVLAVALPTTEWRRVQGGGP
jgi:two-component system, sensor histidine kinase and response regulator